jgi:hypothetical protein
MTPVQLPEGKETGESGSETHAPRSPFSEQYHARATISLAAALLGSGESLFAANPVKNKYLFAIGDLEELFI